ncbi:TIGR04255 family protein [Pantoea sp. Lij88]|uniref:TIGR04255 family protein n=1 Tax=Pantoea sp. Lij88 TaxID=3028622 RepID=UPI0024BB1B5E|nr:TIGR04255 family protein [Pantoea sp. Lij88]WHQ73433.1 TIGR04255 family protein [Pantoea sp. Lij88]
MNEKFANSPLVELVAEVRWKTDHQDKKPIMDGDELDSQELFFSKITSDLASKGYVTSERLIPKGLPLMAGAPVVRFKKSPPDGSPEQKAKELSTLFQVGVGVFTINGIQPYSCWDDFIHVISTGINALLATNLIKAETGYKVSVRYINAFGESFTEGLSLRRFLSEKLGLNIALPKAFDDEFSHGESDLPNLRVSSPLKFGTHIVSFTEGKVKNQSVFLMENAVKINKVIEVDADKIMAEMTIARDVIHKRFFSVTQGLHSVMQLV